MSHTHKIIVNSRDNDGNKSMKATKNLSCFKIRLLSMNQAACRKLSVV